MTNPSNATFTAIIQKLQTTADGGWRITLDAPESDFDAFKALVNMQNKNLQIAVVEYDG